MTPEETNAPVAPVVPVVESTPVVDTTIAPAPVVEPVSTVKATLANFCLAIRDFEGVPGDRNYINNNPGNCRFSSVGYLPVYEPVHEDAQNFAIFKDYATGWLYLENLIKSKVHMHPDQNILQFMEVYAPSSDNNPTFAYATFIAKRCGVDVNFMMKNLIGI